MLKMPVAAEKVLPSSRPPRCCTVSARTAFIMQTPFENDFFDLFGIEKTYSLDHLQLRDRFRLLQKKFHQIGRRRVGKD